MTHAYDGRRRGWTAAMILAAGLCPALLYPSPADAGVSVHSAPTHTRPEIQRLVVNEAITTGTVPAPLALAVAEVSSDFVPRTIGASGAIGVMQLDPEVAASELGSAADALWDPATNVRLGLRYLARLHGRYYGSWELALSHYRGGPLHWTDDGYVPHEYTRDWLQRVMYHWRFYQREPLVRAWIREARGGGSRFSWGGAPRYLEPRIPYRHTYVRWPCACERCWEHRNPQQRARHCDDAIAEPARPAKRIRFNGGRVRWAAPDGGGRSVGYRPGPWVAITGGTRFK